MNDGQLVYPELGRPPAPRVHPVVWRTNRLGPTVGATATQILEADPRRVALIIINPTVSPLYVFFDTSVSPTQGFHVAAGYGTLALNLGDDGPIVTGAWFARIDAGTNDFVFLEGTAT